MSSLEKMNSSFNTSDNVALQYIDTGGSKPVLLLVHGWHQSAIQWKKQITHFSTKYRVIAIDLRGHGESEKTDRGYRISRLSADLYELFNLLDLKNAIVMGHSMGCAIIWSYWDTYVQSRARISKLILVDQSPCMIANPTWDQGIATSLAAILSPTAVYDIGAGLCGSQEGMFTRNFIRSMFTESLNEEDLEWTLEHCLKMDPKNAATLLVDHAAQDWRDVIPTINVPTLVVGAEGSLFNKEGSEWVASHIQGAKLEIFKKEEGGSHFMLWDNHKKFNELVDNFLNN